MNNKQTGTEMRSAQYLRKRKMMAILPLLVIPFLTLAFWSLGGGSSNKIHSQGSVSGLNLQLPNAHLKDDKAENKLSFYEEADMDSVKLGNEMKNDPYVSLRGKDSSDLKIIPNNYSSAMHEISPDPNEIKVYQKIAEINSQLNNTTSKNNLNSNETEQEQKSNAPINTDDVKKLDNMLQNVNKESSDNSDEQDLNKLNGMMEKIIDIQHPERIKGNDKSDNTNIYKVYSLDKPFSVSNISLLDTIKDKNKNNHDGFYNLTDENNLNPDNAIDAVVHEEQTLTNGSIIKLRLLDDVSINGSVVSKGNFLYGIATLNDERLNVNISSIRSGHSLLPINLQVFDIDGLPGIYIPGAITRDVSKQSIDNATQMMSISSLDPSLKMQAANAGIDAAKSLISKKVKLIKVTVKAGYKILLHENNNH